MGGWVKRDECNEEGMQAADQHISTMVDGQALPS